MAGAGASAPTMADAFRLASAPASPAPCASSCNAWTGSPVVVAGVFWSGSGQPGRRRWSKVASRLTFMSSGGGCGLVRNEYLEGGSSLGCLRAFGLGDSRTIRRYTRHTVFASSADIGSGGYREGNEADSPDDQKALQQTTPQVIQPSAGDRKQSLQAVGALAILIVVGLVAAVVVTLSSGGPAALVAAIAKSGFSAAFALIFISEIGDKTFFIAALLAMRHSRGLVLLGASTALGLMTVISVLIGRLCQRVPQQLQTTLPVGEYAAVGLLIWFGLRSIKSAYDLPSAPAISQGDQGAECGELAEAEEFLKKSEGEKKISTPLEVLVEAFSLVFVAEWGDRSMLATVALGAAQSPWGVASGAIAGHVLATALAVIGGAFLAEHISEKVIGYIGGVLFLIFAAATLLGVF